MQKDSNNWFAEQGLRPSRRELLQSFAGVGAGAFADGLFAAPASARDLSGVRVVQLVDQGGDQQEVTRDYVNGIRLALTRSAANPAPPVLVSLPCDGSVTSARAALQKVRADASAVALLGAVGERSALSSISALQQEGWSIAHVAPWLADARFDERSDVFAIFASREAQIRRALTNFAAVGVRDMGVVFTDVAQQTNLGPGLMTMLARLGLQAKAFVPSSQQDMAGFGLSFPDNSPAFLLFLGGAPELVAFGQSLRQRKITRYLIGLADIDVGVLMQLEPMPSQPILLTQVVPNPMHGGSALVRDYRSKHAVLFDEAPSPMGLAGYVAGRYALAVLSTMKGPITRAKVLAEFRLRRSLNLDGYRLDFLKGGRGSEFVDVGVLKAGGKLVG
jgi:hypothetical protein